MANNTYKVVKKTSRKAIKELNAIGKSIYSEGVSRGLRNISEEAVEVARRVLLTADPKLSSQQITPQEAAAEVQAVYNDANKSATIVASLDYSKRNAMFFLEYGAGLSSETSTRRGAGWIYKIQNGDSVHEMVSQKEAYEHIDRIMTDRFKAKMYDEGKSVETKGSSWYGLFKYRSIERIKRDSPKRKPNRYNYVTSTSNFETKVFKYKGKLYGATISSQAIGYMKEARNHINRYASKKMAQSIETVIARRTNRRAPIWRKFY